MSISRINSLCTIGAIGCEAIGAAVTIESRSLRGIYDAYNELFGKYDKMHSVLLGQLGSILGTTNLEKSLNLEAMFDTYPLKDNNNAEVDCKEGIKAYKYYLRDVIMQLNRLYSWIKQAKEDLEKLSALINSHSVGYESEADFLLAQLEISDQHTQEALKAFTEYVVLKDLTVNKHTHYNDGTGQKIDEQTERYRAYESAHITIPVWEGATYNSKLAATYDSLEDLRKLETTKYEVTREINVGCLKDGSMEFTDKYDDLAHRVISITDQEDKSINSVITLFDELTLLDKLKYITLYYKTSGGHYVFPEDPKIGFPCIQPKDNGSPTDDTNEIGQMEIFYIGYLVDRDGPINALASFMEVKTVAIRDQIILQSYRVKALQYYISLTNKGLEKLNESQSDGGMNAIPVSSYNILKYVGINITRSLLYLKDDNGNFLKDTSGKELCNPYIILQAKPDESSKPYHLTQTDTYFLVEASDAGMEAFMEWNADSGIDMFCFEHKESEDTIRYNVSQEDAIASTPNLLFGKKVTQHRNGVKEPGDYNLTSGYLLQFNSRAYSKTYLPKELGVAKLSSVPGKISGPDSDYDWNNPPSEDGYKSTWANLINAWVTQYDTVIANQQSELEFVQKTISSLRKKIDTFDSMASNFRNKAYTIYNKIVNKIN